MRFTLAILCIAILLLVGGIHLYRATVTEPQSDPIVQNPQPSEPKALDPSKHPSEKLVNARAQVEKEGAEKNVQVEKTIASTFEEAAELCGPWFFSYIHRDNVTCPVSDELAATLSDWDVRPFSPPVQQECREVEYGGGRGRVCEWGPQHDPYHGYSDEDLTDLALNQGDALAAAELAHRPMPVDEAYAWMMTAAALADGNRAAGAMLRAAQGFGLQEEVVDGKVVRHYGGLVRRIALEEIALERGHPAATPDYWRGQLKAALGGDDVSPYLDEVVLYKKRIHDAMDLVREGSPQSEVREMLDY